MHYRYQRSLLFLSLLLCILGCQSTNSLAPRKLDIELRWIRSTLSKEHLGFRFLHRLSPVVYKNILIQANTVDGLAALNKNNGNLIWKIHVDKGVGGQPTISDQRIYFGGNNGYFYCADLNSGKIIWKFDTRMDNLAPPSIEGNKVFFLSGNNIVHALNKNTGKSLWRYNRLSTSPISLRGGSKPAFKNNKLYIGFADGFIVALNASDGSLVWERQLNTKPKFKDVDGSPVISDNKIFVSSFDDALYALSLTDGQIIWRVDEGSSTPVSLEGDKIFYTTSNGKILALDLKSGKKIWQHQLKESIGAQPSIWQNQLLVNTSNGPLLIMDKMNGKVLKRYYPGNGSFAPPLIDQQSGRLWLISNSGNVHSLDIYWQRPGLFWEWEK